MGRGVTGPFLELPRIVEAIIRRCERAPIEPWPHRILCGRGRDSECDNRGHEKGARRVPQPPEPLHQNPKTATDHLPAFFSSSRRFFQSISQVAGMMNSGVRTNPSSVLSQTSAI